MIADVRADVPHTTADPAPGQGTERPLRCLLVHNHYQQPGGEDQIYEAEAAVLAAGGHEVERYTVHNDALTDMGRWNAARATFWNGDVYRAVADLCRRVRPDVVHFHNTFPLASPAAYYAAGRSGAAVVQTLHNFRLVCPSALLFRDERPCEECVGRRVAWPAVRHRCYRGSATATAATTAMLASHRAAGTWRTRVHRYIALTEFARAVFVRGGLPADRIAVKPNFLPTDPGVGGDRQPYALFVGRLSPEKGLDLLLEAWSLLESGTPLRIVGDGPLDHLRDVAPPNVIWEGRQPKERVLAMMREAALLVFPSKCYEGFPVVLAEALASGLPVVATDVGAAAEIVAPGRTGVRVPPGDPGAFARAVDQIVSRPDVLRRLGAGARDEYESRYSPEHGLRALLAVYAAARRARVSV